MPKPICKHKNYTSTSTKSGLTLKLCVDCGRSWNDTSDMSLEAPAEEAVNSIELFNQTGSSDKVYFLKLIRINIPPNLFRVEADYGKRNSTLNRRTAGVFKSYTEAMSCYGQLKKEKFQKGYKTTLDWLVRPDGSPHSSDWSPNPPIEYTNKYAEDWAAFEQEQNIKKMKAQMPEIFVEADKYKPKNPILMVKSPFTQSIKAKPLTVKPVKTVQEQFDQTVAVLVTGRKFKDID